MDMFGAIGAWVLTALLGVIAIVWRARKLWQPESGLSGSMKGLAGFLALLAIAGGFGMTTGPLKAAMTVDGARTTRPPSAGAMADSISEGVTYAGLGLGAWLISAVALAFITPKRKAPRQRET